MSNAIPGLSRARHISISFLFYFSPIFFPTLTPSATLSFSEYRNFRLLLIEFRWENTRRMEVSRRSGSIDYYSQRFAYAGIGSAGQGVLAEGKNSPRSGATVTVSVITVCTRDRNRRRLKLPRREPRHESLVLERELLSHK